METIAWTLLDELAPTSGHSPPIEIHAYVGRDSLNDGNSLLNIASELRDSFLTPVKRSRLFCCQH